LSLRNLEEMMCGVTVDHSTIHRWILRLMPVLERTFRKPKAAVGTSWRMDETYIKIGGQWKYIYRAVDRAGNTVDFLLTAKRDRAAAKRFPARAIGNNALPTTITIDQSGANTAGIESYNVEHDTTIAIRQCKYLNNIVEQDHRSVKRIIRPMLRFKSFRCARVILGGIEIMHMICKGQMRSDAGSTLSAALQFYSLAV
jgi:putative transposase